MPFIRQCIECRKCATRYLIAFSPYRNGSYLWRTSLSFWDEYILYCVCQHPPVFNSCKEDGLKTCVVSKAAHDRGYGSTDEVVAMEGLRSARRAVSTRV